MKESIVGFGQAAWGGVPVRLGDAATRPGAATGERRHPEPAETHTDDQASGLRCAGTAVHPRDERIGARLPSGTREAHSPNPPHSHAHLDGPVAGSLGGGLAGSPAATASSAADVAGERDRAGGLKKLAEHDDTRSENLGPGVSHFEAIPTTPMRFYGSNGWMRSLQQR